MESSQPFESVVVLGKKIIEELGMIESCDTLARWMVHHVAELIYAAENSSEEGKLQAQENCRNAILALWKQIHTIPGQIDVFSSVPGIIKTMKALTPEDRQYYYFTQAHTAADAEGVDADTAKWLNVARGLDFTARVLIGMTLRYAAQSAANKDARWIAEAEVAFPNELPSSEVIRILINEKTEDAGPTEQEAQLNLLQERRKELDGFLKMSKALQQEIDNEISALESKSGV